MYIKLYNGSVDGGVEDKYLGCMKNDEVKSKYYTEVEVNESFVIEYDGEKYEDDDWFEITLLRIS